MKLRIETMEEIYMASLVEIDEDKKPGTITILTNSWFRLDLHAEDVLSIKVVA